MEGWGIVKNLQSVLKMGPRDKALISLYLPDSEETVNTPFPRQPPTTLYSLSTPLSLEGHVRPFHREGHLSPFFASHLIPLHGEGGQHHSLSRATYYPSIARVSYLFPAGHLLPLPHVGHIFIPVASVIYSSLTRVPREDHMTLLLAGALYTPPLRGPPTL